MFKNSRTGQSQAELRGYKTEDENTAKARLEAAGWSFDTTYTWDEDKKLFQADAPKEEEADDKSPGGEMPVAA